MSGLPSQFEKHIEVTSPASIAVDLLANETGISKQKIKLIMQKGAVWVTYGKKTQRIRRAKKGLKQGSTLHLYYDEHVLNMQPPEPILLADEGRYSVWNKPYGMLSQGSKWGDHCTITRWAEQHLSPQRNSFVVHRLDRAANGIIIIAHEKNAAASLSKLFHDRQIHKRYQIWVHGEFSQSATKDNPTQVNTMIDGRTAVSYFTYHRYDEERNRTLLDVNIETGRKHQIRRHAVELGFSIVGDRLYGQEGDKEDLQLNAYYMSFKCPYSQKNKEFNVLEKNPR